MRTGTLLLMQTQDLPFIWTVSAEQILSNRHGYLTMTDDLAVQRTRGWWYSSTGLRSTALEYHTLVRGGIYFYT